MAGGARASPAARVELAGDGAHDFLEAALVGRVDVLVAGLDDKLVRLPLGEDLRGRAVGSASEVRVGQCRGSKAKGRRGAEGGREADLFQAVLQRLALVSRQQAAARQRRRVSLAAADVGLEVRVG